MSDLELYKYRPCMCDNSVYLYDTNYESIAWTTCPPFVQLSLTYIIQVYLYENQLYL
jgi:hypothetical protein